MGEYKSVTLVSGMLMANMLSQSKVLCENIVSSQGWEESHCKAAQGININTERSLNISYR